MIADLDTDSEPAEMAPWQITPPPSGYLAPHSLTKLVSAVFPSPISTNRRILLTILQSAMAAPASHDNNSSRSGHAEDREKVDDNEASSFEAGDEEQTTRLDPSLNPGTLSFEDGEHYILVIWSLV